MCYVCDIALWVVPRVIYPTEISSIAWWPSCVVYAYSIIAYTGAIFIDVFFHPNSYSVEFSFWSHTVITIKLYTCRDSCAIVACAKLCCIFHVPKGIKVHRMWTASERSLMKCTLIYIRLVPSENGGNPMVCKVVRCTSSPVVPCRRSLAYHDRGVALHWWLHRP